MTELQERFPDVLQILNRWRHCRNAGFGCAQFLLSIPSQSFQSAVADSLMIFHFQYLANSRVQWPAFLKPACSAQISSKLAIETTTCKGDGFFEVGCLLCAEMALLADTCFCSFQLFSIPDAEGQGNGAGGAGFMATAVQRQRQIEVDEPPAAQPGCSSTEGAQFIGELSSLC